MLNITFNITDEQLVTLWGREISQLTPETEKSLNLYGLQVLLVENNFDSRELFTFLLQEFGAQVIAVALVSEALEALERHQIDILIGDIELPVEDGYSLVSKIRTREAEKGGKMIPAIAVTCADREEDRIRARAAGFQSHMSKPVDVYELVKVVASFAGRKGKFERFQ